MRGEVRSGGIDWGKKKGMVEDKDKDKEEGERQRRRQGAGTGEYPGEEPGVRKRTGQGKKLSHGDHKPIGPGRGRG